MSSQDNGHAHSQARGMAFEPGTSIADKNMALRSLSSMLNPTHTKDQFISIYREWLKKWPCATTGHSHVANEAEKFGYKDLAVAMRRHKFAKIYPGPRPNRCPKSTLAERIEMLEDRFDKLVERLGGDE